jgi:hypothetical protein
MEMHPIVNIYPLDKTCEKALGSQGPVEAVVTLKADGSIDIYHPESNPVIEVHDPDHLSGKKVKHATPITYIHSTSGCIYIGGRCYCW